MSPPCERIRGFRSQLSRVSFMETSCGWSIHPPPNQQLTNTMWQSLSEVCNSSASKEIPRILWKQTVHYRVHNSPPSVPIISQINPVHAPILFLEDRLQYYPPIYRLSSKWSLAPTLPHQNPVYIYLYPKRATWLYHHNLLDCITAKMFAR
jgi:hypothetical protein